MSTPCDTTLWGGVTFFLRHHHFGHDFEHWPLANPYVVNVALQLKRLPTPALGQHKAYTILIGFESTSS